MIRELKPHVIWTTFPIATAHAIGARLQHISGLPWIADFRDSMLRRAIPPTLSLGASTLSSSAWRPERPAGAGSLRPALGELTPIAIRMRRCA